jgi:hypothetical protein
MLLGSRQLEFLSSMTAINHKSGKGNRMATRTITSLVDDVDQS